MSRNIYPIAESRVRSVAATLSAAGVPYGQRSGPDGLAITIDASDSAAAEAACPELSLPERNPAGVPAVVAALVLAQHSGTSASDLAWAQGVLARTATRIVTDLARPTPVAVEPPTTDKAAAEARMRAERPLPISDVAPLVPPRNPAAAAGAATPEGSHSSRSVAP